MSGVTNPTRSSLGEEIQELIVATAEARELIERLQQELVREKAKNETGKRQSIAAVSSQKQGATWYTDVSIEQML